jgi:hypothetical protein
MMLSISKAAIAVGRKLVHCPITVFGGDGFDPLCGILAQVFGGHGAAQFRGGLQDGVCNVAFVKSGLASLGNDGERVR